MATNQAYARTVRLGMVRAAVCALLTFLVGCSSVSMPEPVTITFAYWEDDTEQVETLVQEFEEQYPYITVNLRPESAGGLAWDLGPGDADVRDIFVAIVDAQRERGDFMSLDPFIAADASFDLSDFYPATLEALTVERQIWAIPYGVDASVMYYNQDLFDQYGVPYPEIGWTWDDFVSTAQAIRDPEADVYGYISIGGGWELVVYIYQYGGRILDDMQTPTHATFDDSLTVEAMEWYGNLFHEYDVAPTPQELQASSSMRDTDYAKKIAVVNGKAGMWSFAISCQGGLGGFWEGLEWPMHWGMVTLPQATGNTATGVVGDLFVNGYAISSQTQHPDAAWQLVAFLSAHMRDHYVPVRRSHAESAEYEQRVGSNAAAVARAVLENAMPYSPRRFIDATLESLNILGEAAALIESGERTAQEAMYWAQQEAEARIDGDGE
jgi:multiple sugar transport system substrate-binding protein